MFTLITLATGRSFYMDFGMGVGLGDSNAGRWGISPDAAPELRSERLLAACNEAEPRAAALQALGQECSHTLPSLASLDEWQADDIRASIASELAKQHRDVGDNGNDALGSALRAGEHAAVVTTLLGSDRWQVLAGLWLCPATDLIWAAYTPRNKDEVRVRARALLGIEGFADSALDGVPFLGDDTISPLARLRLVEAMGRSEVTAAVPTLIELLDHPDIAMQREVIIALGRIGSSGALMPLLGLWDARDGALRGSIRGALRGLSSLQGANYLRSFVESNSPVMVERALFIDDQFQLRRELPKDWLLPLLSSSKIEARRDAASLLAVFGDETDARMLRDLADREADQELQSVAKQGADNLARCGRRQPVVLSGGDD